MTETYSPFVHLHRIFATSCIAVNNVTFLAESCTMLWQWQKKYLHGRDRMQSKKKLFDKDPAVHKLFKSQPIYVTPVSEPEQSLTQCIQAYRGSSHWWQCKQRARVDRAYTEICCMYEKMDWHSFWQRIPHSLGSLTQQHSTTWCSTSVPHAHRERTAKPDLRA